MTYEREDELVKKLENKKNKIEDLEKMLEEKFKEQHLEGSVCKQKYVNNLYANINGDALDKLDKVIDKYNSRQPEEEKILKKDSVIEMHKDAIADMTVLFLQHGHAYGRENTNLDDYIYDQFKDSMKDVKSYDLQNIVDEITKNLENAIAEQGFMTDDDKLRMENFEKVIKLYSNETLIRLNVPDFAKANKLAEDMEKKLYVDKEILKKMPKEKQEIEKAKIRSEFKYEFKKLARTERPEDLQIAINILDKRISREDRKTLDSAIKLNNKERSNKFETRRIKLSENEKDDSWQKIKSKTVLMQQLQNFRKELAEMKRRPGYGPVDKYDTGIVSGLIRKATHITNFIEKVSNFIHDTIEYHNPEFKKDDKTEQESVQDEKNQEAEKQSSPFFAVMHAAYEEKGQELVLLLSADAISKKQAEQMFIKDMAYIETLEGSKKNEMYSAYANSLSSGMRYDEVSVAAKNVIRELLANYEQGKYTEQISKTVDEKDFDWESITPREVNKDKKVIKEPKQDKHEKVEQNDISNEKTRFEDIKEAFYGFSALGNVITVTDMKSSDLLDEALDNYKNQFDKITKAKREDFAQLAIAIAVSKTSDDKLLYQIAEKYKEKNMRLNVIDKASIADKLLYGAALESTYRSKNGITENTHEYIQKTVNEMETPEEKQNFISKLIDKQSNDRQRFIITKEAASLGIEAKSQKTISEKECKAVISSFASEYINKIEKNNYRLPSEELTTSKCTQLSSALSPQEVFEQVIQKINANKNITENIKNKAINNLLEDAAFYNKTLQKEIIDISDLKKIQEKISKPKETQNETKGHIFSNEISKNAPQNTTEPAKMKSIISNDDMAKKHAENFNKESKNASADFINDIKNYTPKEQEEIVKKIDKDIKNDAKIAKAFIDAVKESKISTDMPECNKIIDKEKSNIENEEQIEEQDDIEERD